MESLAEITTVSYKCSKCNYSFSRVLPSQVQVSGLGGTCPSCGNRDGIPGQQIFEYNILQQKARILME